MKWPWQKSGPDLETRATQMDLSVGYMGAKRQTLTHGSTPLSATIAACAGAWSRSFAMLRAEPEPDTLPPDMLASVGLSLLLRGESVWHIRLSGGVLDFVPVAAWDELGGGKYTLHISRPNSTETVAALEGEVLKLIINPDPLAPWRGRSPLALAGLTPLLMAEIEQALSGALPYAGKGLLPMPSSPMISSERTWTIGHSGTV